ncbi:MAG: septal ring lytic transglycosylase RlpA family protein [Proteobacteria bacterium]|nr:septal ring lytic transglycosylase RlpA family protein [Pseudomonadota bacterium]
MGNTIFRHIFSISTAVLLFIFTLEGCLPRQPLPEKREPAPSNQKISPYKIGNIWYHPIPHSRGFRQEGLASWYGKDFHGKKTANGEIYNMYAMTAAHKTLPLGTWVRIENKVNDKKITVRINDRGPFVAGRIIDLSYTAAKELDIVGPGTAPVEVIALGTPDPDKDEKTPLTFIPGDYYSGNFVIQIGAFKERENAERLTHSLSGEYENAHLVPFQLGMETFYRVRIGHFSDLSEAKAFEEAIASKGFPQAFVVAE